MYYIMTYINGPYNYVQLTGSINTIRKNITIFMDVHQNLDNQTRCDSFDSIDISQYLYKLIKDSKEPLDFFLEIRNEQIQKPITDKRDIYIFEVIEMFKTEFIIEKDKVKYSKSNPNVRLHYLDIRDYLQFNNIIKQLKNDVLPKLNFLQNNNPSDFNKINKIEELKQHIEDIQRNVISIFEKNIDIKQNRIRTFDKKSQEYFISKIIHKYKHKNLKKNINDFYNVFLLQYLKNFTSIFGTMLHILYNKDLDNLKNIFKLYGELEENLFALYGLITDVFFLRRLLDKDYIENVITYCGRNHALNFIYFLIKHCDFKIIKIYNSNSLSLEEFTNQIKETDELNKVHNLFLIEGEKPKQCITKPNPHYLLGW